MVATLNHSQWVDTKILSQPLLLFENPQDWKVSQNKGTTNCRKQNNLETKPCYGDRIQSRGAEAKNIRKFFFDPKKRHTLDSFFLNSCGSIIDFCVFVEKESHYGFFCCISTASLMFFSWGWRFLRGLCFGTPGGIAGALRRGRWWRTGAFGRGKGKDLTVVRVVESQENAVDIQWIVFFVLKLYNLGWKKLKCFHGSFRRIYQLGDAGS